MAQESAFLFYFLFFYLYTYMYIFMQLKRNKWNLLDKANLHKSFKT